MYVLLSIACNGCVMQSCQRTPIYSVILYILGIFGIFHAPNLAVSWKRPNFAPFLLERARASAFAPPLNGCNHSGAFCFLYLQYLNELCNRGYILDYVCKGSGFFDTCKTFRCFFAQKRRFFLIFLASKNILHDFVISEFTKRGGVSGGFLAREYARIYYILYTIYILLYYIILYYSIV